MLPVKEVDGSRWGTGCVSDCPAEPIAAFSSDRRLARQNLCRAVTPPRGETEFWIDERTPETPPQFEPLDVAVWLPHAGRCLFDIGQFCE